MSEGAQAMSVAGNGGVGDCAGGRPLADGKRRGGMQPAGRGMVDDHFGNARMATAVAAADDARASVLFDQEDAVLAAERSSAVVDDGFDHRDRAELDFDRMARAEVGQPHPNEWVQV